MFTFITYSNDLYAKTRDYCALMAVKKGGAHRTIAYTPEDIDKAFMNRHYDILSEKTGNGLWLWKPYFLYKTLKDVENGEVVFYCDAGSFFFRSAKPILETMDDDIWVSDIPLIEKQYTKPELIDRMNCNSKDFLETNQIQANFIAVRKSDRGLKFVKEWLSLCESIDNIGKDTKYDKLPPVDFCFLGHRYDQSVLSLLSKKWSVPVHLDPSQFGRVPEKYYSKDRIFRVPSHSEKYKPCIILHRTKDVDKAIVRNQRIMTWLPRFIIAFFSKNVSLYKGKKS